MRLAVRLAALLLGLAMAQDTAESQVAGSTIADHTVRNCAHFPSTCGYPDQTNTGVQPGTTLRRIPQDVTRGDGWVWDRRGWVSINKPGTSFEGFELGATIVVEADQVTIKNVRVVMFDGRSAAGINIAHAKGVHISNCEIGSPSALEGRLMVGIKDTYGDSKAITITRCNIYHTATGVQIYEGTIEGNYIHDMGFVEGDHTNGVTSNGGSGLLVVRGNTIFNQLAQTDAVSLFQDFAIEANRVVESNLLAGGGYVIYGGAGAKGPSHDIKINNNRISRRFFANGGKYGVLTYFERLNAGNSFEGNFWDETGKPIR